MIDKIIVISDRFRFHVGIKRNGREGRVLRGCTLPLTLRCDSYLIKFSKKYQLGRLDKKTRRPAIQVVEEKTLMNVSNNKGNKRK